MHENTKTAYTLQEMEAIAYRLLDLCQQVRGSVEHESIVERIPRQGKPELLYIKDVAERLGKSTDTIYRWIRQNEMPKPLEISGKWAYLAEDIDSWLREKSRGGVPNS